MGGNPHALKQQYIHDDTYNTCAFAEGERLKENQAQIVQFSKRKQWMIAQLVFEPYKHPNI